jgi:two-component system, chemotaxis family, sensor kinase Cph1
METILDFLEKMFQTENWPARRTCGIWTPFHGWLYIISSALIALAYFAIPIILFLFVQKRKNEIPFPKIFWLFILFILACGITHVLDGLVFWFPFYRLSAMILFVTAIISCMAVVGLYKVLPDALSLKTNVQLEAIINERTKELEKSNRQLMRKNEELDNFVYSVSHDLKSPINNIEGLLSILEDDVNAGRDISNQVIERMHSSLDKSRLAINQISNLVKLGAKPFQDIQENSFSNILNEVMKENEILFLKYNVQIVSNFKVNELTYSYTGLKSIIYNLLINAAKYSSEKRIPLVKLDTFLENGKTMLVIEDNGMGIDLKIHADNMFKLFKRFHDHVEGAGLGLYTIKKILEGTDSDIDLESEVDKGTKFKIRF